MFDSVFLSYAEETLPVYEIPKLHVEQLNMFTEETAFVTVNETTHVGIDHVFMVIDSLAETRGTPLEFLGPASGITVTLTHICVPLTGVYWHVKDEHADSVNKCFINVRQ